MPLRPIPAPDELFDFRGTNNGVSLVPLTRPYQQGDVFCDVEIPGVENPSKLAMLFLHPCTMRSGVSLRTQVTVAAVTVFTKKKVIPGDTYWEKDHYNLMPLPDMDGKQKSTYAADFLLLGTVKSRDLDRSKRIAGLTFEGQQVLHQRTIHHFSRLIPMLDDLEKATRPVELEIQAQTLWVEAAAAKSKSIADAEVEFTRWMNQNDRRQRLETPYAHTVLSETAQERVRLYG